LHLAARSGVLKAYDAAVRIVRSLNNQLTPTRQSSFTSGITEDLNDERVDTETLLEKEQALMAQQALMLPKNANNKTPAEVAESLPMYSHVLWHGKEETVLVF
jgi:hypothetical protein